MKNRIKEIRKINRLTQKEFADKLGIKQNTVACYEKGRITMSNNIIVTICNVFNVNKEWLIYGKGEMYKSLNNSIEIVLNEYINKENPSYNIIKEILTTYQQLDDNSKIVLRKIIK